MNENIEQRNGFVRYDKNRDITICNIRNVKFTPSVEDSEKGKKLIIKAYPILFNTPTMIRDEDGVYEEIIYPSAFNGVDFRGVKLLMGHDPNAVLGVVGIGETEAGADNIGIFLKSDLAYPNTQEARDAYNKIEKGLVDGMSWGFRTSDPIKNGRREVRSKIELFEFSITAFPAYYLASVVAARSEVSKVEMEKPKFTLADALNELKREIK